MHSCSTTGIYIPEKAVKRLANNELLAGICFVIGPILALLLHSPGKHVAPFNSIFGIVQAGGIALQAGHALRIQATGR